MQEVLVTDLGAAECRMLGLSAGVTKNDRLELWFGDAGPFVARLKWAKRGLLGAEFERPLDAAVLESLASADPAPNVVPMRRTLTD